MIYLEDCITAETPITFVNKFFDSSYEYEDGSGKLVYAKAVCCNEFIGERLARIRNLRSPEHFLVMESSFLGKCKFGELDPRKIEKLKIGTYDFRKKGYKYLRINSLGIGEDGFFYLLDLCPNKQNRDELTNELLEMFALDTYMAQDDRFYYNMLMEIDWNDNIHLAPIYDFEETFTERNTIYLNTLRSFPTIDDYRKFIWKFPQLGSMLETYLDVDLEEEIKEILEEKRLDYSNVNFQFYRDFSCKRKDVLRKILK